MIKRMYVDNFRCLVNFELELSPLNLILGANGAGKSTVLEVLRILRSFITGEGSTDDYFPSRTLTRWTNRDKQTFELDVQGAEGLYTYALTIEHHASRKLCRLTSEKLSFEGKPLYVAANDKAQLYRDDFSQGPQVLCDWSRSGLGIIQDRHDNALLTWFKRRVSDAWVLSIDPHSMTSRTEEEHSHPAPDMSDFASWYRHLSQDQQSQVFELTGTLKEGVLDGFQSFRLKEEGERERALVAKFAPRDGDQPGETVEFRFDELSDGQRVLVALYTLAACTFEEGRTLCLDQPESFLALPEIQPWLMKLVDATQEGLCQALLVSHHPALIDLLAASSGHWIEREEGGPTRVKPITDDGKSGLPISELVSRGWLHG